MAGLQTRKKQRLLVVSTALAALLGAVALVLYALGGDSLSLFLQPTSVLEKNIKQGQHFRLGGLVKMGSFDKLDDGLTYVFKVTDCVADIDVRYRDLLPDLFREGQGVVVEGALDASGTFVADKVLAKHDENYAAPGTMPKNVAACEHPEAAGGYSG